MNKKQLALIKKDVRGIMFNKQIMTVMFSVPIVLTLIVPSIFVILILFVPDAIEELEPLLKQLPIIADGSDKNQLILELLVNKIMPSFFLLIPIMASSVMAASSFVGEKEKHTLETLLYSPMSLKEIFQSKILAGFSIGMMVSCVSFLLMIIVIEIEVFVFKGTLIVPDISWLIIMLLVSPAISIIAIAITVRGSAKAQTTEEAQQSAVFLVFPIVALAIGQFTGIILISPLLLLGLGIILAAAAMWLLRSISGRFTYEKLL